MREVGHKNNKGDGMCAGGQRDQKTEIQRFKEQMRVLNVRHCCMRASESMNEKQEYTEQSGSAWPAYC